MDQRVSEIKELVDDFRPIETLIKKEVKGLIHIKKLYNIIEKAYFNIDEETKAENRI